MSSIWPNTVPAFLAFLMTVAAGSWWWWLAVNKWAEVQIEKVTKKTLDYKQLSELLTTVHTVEDNFKSLSETVEDIRESEADHKAHVKERLNEMKETVRELNQNIMQLLTGGGLNKTSK